MLSLPLQPPLDDQSTWLRPYQRPRPESPPPNAQNPQQNHRDRQRRDEEKRLFNARSPLALLTADELAISQRRSSVRNFGAYWIRPPGTSKTLQAMTEEEAERLEQAEMERQERGLLDMQAQQQLEEARQRAAEVEAQEAAGDLEEERDLDDDIPDADADTTDVTFNEDSMMEGSQLDSGEENDDHYAEMEEAELTGAARDEEELGMELERDLDDSIPEAGSYQHTDTEVEDTDSESELQNSFAAQSARRSAATAPSATPGSERHGLDLRAVGGLQDRMRAQLEEPNLLPRSPGSLRLSSSMQESSILDSSPMLQRANANGRGRGGMRRFGRPS